MDIQHEDDTILHEDAVKEVVQEVLSQSGGSVNHDFVVLTRSAALVKVDPTAYIPGWDGLADRDGNTLLAMPVSMGLSVPLDGSDGEIHVVEDGVWAVSYQFNPDADATGVVQYYWNINNVADDGTLAPAPAAGGPIDLNKLMGGIGAAFGAFTVQMKTGESLLAGYNVTGLTSSPYNVLVYAAVTFIRIA